MGMVMASQLEHISISSCSDTWCVKAVHGRREQSPPYVCTIRHPDSKQTKLNGFYKGVLSHSLDVKTLRPIPKNVKTNEYLLFGLVFS